MQKILVIDDEDAIRSSLQKLLNHHNFDTCLAHNLEEALEQYSLDSFNLIISELHLPSDQGSNLLNMANNTPVIIMSSYASLRSAVQAMRMGAADYLPKPFDNNEVLAAVTRILGQAKQQNRPPQRKDTSKLGMIGNSAAMQKVFNIIHKVAKTDASVLIQGETGTGKELATSAIHRESQRANNPLICVNCAAIPQTLIEAELFGHEKGAFTGANEARTGLVAAANSGTLFLDEIGELPLEAQARLLRVLQEGEVRPIGSVKSRKVDIRLVSATHRNLQKMCSEGQFREDLFYRINVVNLDLPPLRERAKDALKIAESLLRRFCKKMHRPQLNFEDSAVHTILNYNWPGNIRELENALQRAVILCDEGNNITDDLLGINLRTIRNATSPPSFGHETIRNRINSAPPEGLSLEDYFTRFVIENQDSMSETALAKKLGISRKCLWQRRHKLGIPRKTSNEEQ